MLKILLKLLLCFLAFGLTGVGAYNYDERIGSEQIVKSHCGAISLWYDASSTPANYRELKGINFREKIHGGSFFTFISFSNVTKGLNNGANSASNGLKLKKQLASQEQLGELSKGGGDVIGQSAKQATRIASETGQNAQDIQKVTSSVRKFSDGSQVETHAFRNAKTNELIQPKIIVNPRQR